MVECNRCWSAIRTAVLVVVMAAGPAAVVASVDPGLDGSARPARTPWQTARSDADKQAVLLMHSVDRAFDAKDPHGALKLLRKLTELRPRDATVFNNMGVALVEIGDLSGAATAFQKAVEVDPEYAQGALNLALLKFELGSLDDARRTLHSWSLRIADYPVMGLLLAKIERARGQTAAADRLLDRVLAAPTIKPLVLFETARLLKNWNDRRAESAFRRVMIDDPTMIGASLSLVNLMRSSGRLTEARKVLNDVALRAPDHPSLLLERGMLNAQAGRLEEAVFDLDRAVAKNPGLFDATFLAADCLVRLGRRSAALLRLELLLDPKRPVPAEEREAARQLMDQLTGPVHRMQLKPPEPQAIRAALERTRGMEPRLDWLLWSGVAPTKVEGQPVISYHIQGRAPVVKENPLIEASVWVGRDKWPSGTRPRSCPEVQPVKHPAPWLTDLARTLREKFSQSTFVIEESWVGQRPERRQFVAVGQPDPRVWLLVRAAYEPDTVPRVEEVLERAGHFVRTATGPSPAATLCEMSESVEQLHLASPRVWLNALIVAPRGPPVVLQVSVHSSVSALLSREQSLVQPQAPSTSLGYGPRTQTAGWFDGCPAAEGRERSSMAVSGIALSSMGDLRVYVGRYEVSLSSWSEDGIRELPNTMHHVLRLMFPTSQAVGKGPAR